MTRVVSSSINFPFRDVWSVSDRQKGLFTCTSISPSGMWLVSCSQDGTILFVDHKAGFLISILDLESRFYVTDATWRSDTILILGCSNGIVYHLDFEQRSKRPVGVHTMIKPLKSLVRCIAYDTFRDMLSVACGGEVWIYVRSASAGNDSWDCVDHILAPCAGAPGLVTSLCWFGTTLSCRHLFVGHAKAGWTIWLSPRTYHRTPYVEKGDICTIGSATIPTGEQFIAIATLDNSLVTYSLSEEGPIVDSRTEFSSREKINYRPVLPIASTSNDLVFKGTIVGDIEVLDLKTHSTASLHHAYNHIIRTLNSYGDKVIVGSSDLTDSYATSCLRCYTFSSAAEPRDWRRIDELQGPIFEITLRSILPFSERIWLCGPLGIFNSLPKTWFKARCDRRVVVLLVGLCGLLIALALEPPSAPPSNSPAVPSTSVSAHGIRVSPIPESQPYPRHPALSTLITWCAKYMVNRVSAWVLWLSQYVIWFIHLGIHGGLMVVKNMFITLSLLTQAFLLAPRLIRAALVELPDKIAMFICETLRQHGFDDACPM